MSIITKPANLSVKLLCCDECESQMVKSTDSRTDISLLIQHGDNHKYKYHCPNCGSTAESEVQYPQLSYQY